MARRPNNMSNGKLNEQLLIGFRVLMVAGVLAGAGLFFKMNKSLTIMAVNMQHMSDNMEKLSAKIDNGGEIITANKDNIADNKTRIAVHENRIDNLENKHD